MPRHGRDDELRTLAAVTDGALLLSGQAGTGRTSLQQGAAARAAPQQRVLRSGETGLPGAVLAGRDQRQAQDALLAAGKLIDVDESGSRPGRRASARSPVFSAGVPRASYPGLLPAR